MSNPVGTSEYVLRLSDASRRDAPSAGVKAANLGELAAAGIPVPAGFVLTTAAFERFLASNGFGPGSSPEPSSQAGFLLKWPRPSPWPQPAWAIAPWPFDPPGSPKTCPGPPTPANMSPSSASAARRSWQTRCGDVGLPLSAHKLQPTEQGKDWRGSPAP